MTSSDPRRLRDDPATDDALRAALEAGRAERPRDAQLSALLARIEAHLVPDGGGDPDGGPDGDPGGESGGPSGGGASGASAAPIGAPVLQGVAVLALAAAVAVGGAFMFSAPDAEPGAERSRAPAEPIPTDSTDSSHSIEPAPDEPVALPEGLDAPAVEPETRAARPARPPRAPTLESDPAAEAALIRRAQTSLADAPARSLALADEHARRFGDGLLAQEREVVAIDALTRLGRTPAARRRADAFRARWPRSAHQRRIDLLLSAP